MENLNVKSNAMKAVRVLLVDDQVEFVETLVKRMTKRGLDIRGVSSGQEAFAVLDAEPVDVVILDVKMPDMDGIEVLKGIKRRHPDIEVIMLTGHASLELAMKGMKSGAYDYLMKPMDIDELLYKIEDAYNHKLLEAEKGSLGQQPE